MLTRDHPHDAPVRVVIRHPRAPARFAPLLPVKARLRLPTPWTRVRPVPARAHVLVLVHYLHGITAMPARALVVGEASHVGEELATVGAHVPANARFSGLGFRV